MLKKQEIGQICWVRKQQQLADSLTKIGGNILPLINITTGTLIDSK